VVGDKAEELQSVLAFVGEMMSRVRRDEDRAARTHGSGLVTAYDAAFAGQDENLVLPWVRMMRGVSAWGHLEVSHGKMRGTVILGYQPADSGAFSATLSHLVRFHFGVVNRLESQPGHHDL
jgi:hypothetical protein